MRSSAWAGALWLAVLSAATATSEAAAIKGLRLWSGPDATRVVLDLSGPAGHRLFTLANPDRIVIDLDDGELTAPLHVPERKGFVEAVRTGKRPDGELRVVLDLTQSVKPKSFLLSPNGTYGYRLVIDLMSTRSEPVVKRAPASPARDVIIAIDAGHGGEDPGASGPRGAREKDVVLALAHRVAERIDQEPGMRALLIRDGDYFIPLRDRMGRARAASADLFISIHADSYHDSRVQGATVYVLSDKGASDEARALARRENASDLIGGVSLSDKEPMLRQVLLDLSQNAALSASTAVGDRVIRRMGHVTSLRKTSVQRGPFAVLKSPDIPSILVETAYISNPKEEATLQDPAYQAELAHAMYAGVVDYFRANPPPNTYIAANPPAPPPERMRHIVGRGDTLSGIAQRYNVSLSGLKQSNQLRGDRIRVGQVLTIPTG